MKKFFIFMILMATATFTFTACSSDDNDDSGIVEVPTNPSNPDGSGSTDNPSGSGSTDNPSGSGSTDNPSGSGSTDNPSGSGSTDTPDTPSSKSKILVTYFSWGGNTRNVANRIVELTGATMYEIQPATPYTSNYTELAYTVARNELDTNARPALKDKEAPIADYDYIFIGCPVWWQTAPMIISTFCETYDFSGKTVIPFCTYASTGRDATIQKICDLTPKATHLNGFGTSGGNTRNVESWLKSIGIIK